MPVLRTNYQESRGPQICALSDQQVEALHSATLEVMERTGCRVYEPEGVELLKKAGAHVSDGNRVRIPSHLVEWALSVAPKRVVLCDRDGKRVMPLEGRNVFYGPGSDCMSIIDSRTGERRSAVLQDVLDGIKVVEAMPNMDFVMSMFLPSDVPNEVVTLRQMEAMLVYSRKPIVYITWDFPTAIDATEMAAAAAGGMDELRQHPFSVLYVNVATSLRHNQDSVQKLLYAAGLGLPVIYVPGGARGLASPMTAAGAMAMSNACQLTGLIMAQLKREGTPFIRGGAGGGTLDMKTMVSCYAAPGRSGGVDLPHRYGLPIFGIAGASDSKVFDQQAAMEASLSIYMSALSGANLVHDVGYLDCAMTGSLDLLVFCDEVISWVKRSMEPLEIDDETLALDLIDEVGPDGYFFETDHTLRHYREEWYPRFQDRSNYAAWERFGKKTMADNVRAKVLELLGGPTAEVVSPDTAARVREVLGRASERLIGTKA